MRSVIFVFIIILGGALAGGYAIVWQSQSIALKNYVTQSIAKINEKQQYISYDSIEVSGFPQNLYVSIIKPRFKGRIDLILKAMQQNGVKTDPQLENQIASLSPWDEDDALDGNITFGISALSDVMSLGLTGNWRESSKIGDKAITTLHQQAGSTGCVVKISHQTGLMNVFWNFKSLETDFPSIIKNFSMIDCNHPGSTIIDADTKEKLAASGPLRFYVTRNDVPDGQQIRVYFRSVDAEITPQGDAMLASYIHAISPHYAYPIDFSIYGKQNAEIDFIYVGPVKMPNNDITPTMHIVLSKFDITNNVYTHHMNFLMDNAIDTGTRSMSLKFRAESKFSPQYDVLLQNMVRAFLQEAHNSKEPQLQGLQTQFRNYTPDQLYSIIYPAMFSFNSLGNMVEAVDLAYKGSPDFTSGDVTVNNLEISTTPYGIKANGSTKMDKRIPQGGTVTIACSNCLAMIDDIVAYASRLQKTMSYFTPEKTKNMNINPGQVEATKKLLLALAAPATDTKDVTTLRYTIISNPSSGITINGKKISEVMAMANEYQQNYMSVK